MKPKSQMMMMTRAVATAMTVKKRSTTANSLVMMISSGRKAIFTVSWTCNGWRKKKASCVERFERKSADVGRREL